jgi:membrane protease YdiL (CAAX protease family)
VTGPTAERADPHRPAPIGNVRQRVDELRTLVAAALFEQRSPEDHPDEGDSRRRIVVALTLAAGAVLLGFSLATKPGDPAFYALTLAVAAVWILGGVLSGPLHLGRIPFRGTLRRPVITPLALGIIAAAVFVLGSLVIREIEPLRSFAAHVLAHARHGSLPWIVVVTLVNGAAEEVFFRGAVYAALGGRHPVPLSVLIYALVTVATANPMLIFAALVMGTVFALQRRASGGILAPMLTHLTWSAAMLFTLPPLIGT